MKVLTNKSLGIHVSATEIHVALLKESKGKLSMLNACKCDLPVGAIIDGNIADIELLGKTVRQLLNENSIGHHKVTVSLVARPALSQIVDLPDEMPGNLRQFILGEIRHSAVLAGKDIRFDFSGLGGPGSKRALVAAADDARMVAIVKAMDIAGLTAVAIELPMVSCLRAVYDSRIAGHNGQNTIVSVVRKTSMDICVFKRGRLDFIHRVVFDSHAEGSYTDQFLHGLESVIQYYDVEKSPDEKIGWNVVAILENDELDSQSIEQQLCSTQGREIYFCRPETIYDDTPVTNTVQCEKSNIIAVGLAMRILKGSWSSGSINLLPPEVNRVRSVKRFSKITAVAAMAVIAVMLTLTGSIGLRASKAGELVTQVIDKNSPDTISEIIKLENEMSSNIDLLKKHREELVHLLGDNNNADWPQILKGIASKTSRNICITRMSCSDNTNLVVYGKSMTHKAVHVFAESLGQLDMIDSAIVGRSSKEMSAAGVIGYSINCQIAHPVEAESDGN